MTRGTTHLLEERAEDKRAVEEREERVEGKLRHERKWKVLKVLKPWVRIGRGNVRDNKVCGTIRCETTSWETVRCETTRCETACCESARCGSARRGPSTNTKHHISACELRKALGSMCVGGGAR